MDGIVCDSPLDRRRAWFADCVEAVPGRRRRVPCRVARACARCGCRGGAGRGADRAGSSSRATAVAINSEQLGRRVARQRHPVHPRHRPGVTDAHGRTAQHRNPGGALLPVHVSRPRRGVESAHRRRPDHRLHAQLSCGGDLAVSRQRRDADVAAAAYPDRRMAHGWCGGHRCRAVGVVHRDSLRRLRHRLDAQPRFLRHRRADHGADRVRTAAPRPHPAGGACAARGVLRAHHGRRGDSAAGCGMVGFRCTLAPCARPHRRRDQPAADRDSHCRAAPSAVSRGATTGRDHRRARVRHP